MKNNTPGTILLYLLMAAGLGTLFAPVLKVRISPLPERRWSVMDIVRTIPKGISAKNEKSSFTMNIDFDYMDAVTRILPKKAGKRTGTFLQALLVPVALLATYLLLLMSIFLTGFRKMRSVGALLLVAIGTSAYALIGTHQLGLAAQRAFARAVGKAAQGFWGAFAKTFVQESTFQPDWGLYVLFAICVLAFATQFILHKTKPVPRGFGFLVKDKQT